MSFWQFLQLNWSELLGLIGEHVKVVLIAIAVAVAIGVPTGILLTRHRALRETGFGGRAREIAFPGKQLKQAQFVQIEGSCRHELIMLPLHH